ncbi:MAG: nucleotidyltransferase family protein [Candidatus Zixiibacteriota bacterium]
MVAGMILAAGQAKHLGGAKPLLVQEQASMLETVVSRCRSAALDDLIVVLGHEARRMVQRLNLGGLKVVINGQFRLGLASSIQRGLAYVASRSQAVMLALGDMPLVTTETIDRLIREYKRGRKGIVVPVHDQRRGHPLIVDMKYLEFFLGLRGDISTHAVADAFPKDVREVPIDSDEVLVDVDTRDDLDRIKPRLAAPAGMIVRAL